MLKKFLLFCPNFSRRNTVYLFEHPAKVCLILKTRFFRNFVNRVVGFQEHFCCQENSISVKVLPKGKTYLFVENSRQIIFAYVYSIGKFPADNLLGSIFIKIKYRFFYQCTRMRRHNLISSKNFMNSRIKLFRIGRSAVAEYYPWMRAQHLNFFLRRNSLRQDDNRNKDCLWIFADFFDAFFIYRFKNDEGRSNLVKDMFKLSNRLNFYAV